MGNVVLWCWWRVLLHSELLQEANICPILLSVWFLHLLTFLLSVDGAECGLCVPDQLPSLPKNLTLHTGIPHSATAYLESSRKFHTAKPQQNAEQQRWAESGNRFKPTTIWVAPPCLLAYTHLVSNLSSWSRKLSLMALTSIFTCCYTHTHTVQQFFLAIRKLHVKIYKLSHETSALIYFLLIKCPFKWIKMRWIH